MDEENKENPEAKTEGTEFDIKKASREELEAHVLEQAKLLEEQGETIKETQGHVDGLDEQCTELAIENRELRRQGSPQSAATAREDFLAERVGRAPRYIPPRKLQGAELEAAKRRVLARYKGKVVVNVGPTFDWVTDDKDKKRRVQDKTKPTHVPLHEDHIIGINEGDDMITAVLADTQKLRIEKGGK